MALVPMRAAAFAITPTRCWWNRSRAQRRLRIVPPHSSVLRAV